MKVRKTLLAAGTPVIKINDFGLACTGGVALILVAITLIVFFKPAVMTVVVVEEQTTFLPLSESVEIILCCNLQHSLSCVQSTACLSKINQLSNLVYTQFPVGMYHCILHSCGLRCSLTV